MKPSLFAIFILILSSFFEGRAQVMISEIVAAPGSERAGSALSRADWIELCNAGDTALNPEGYFLSDDERDPFQYRIGKGFQLEPGECRCFVSDGDQDSGGLPFSLNRKGEIVLLYDTEGIEVDRLAFQMQYEGVSYGRIDGKTGYMELPTPGEANKGPVLNDRCNLPELTPEPGIFRAGGKRTITIERIDSLEVFYTLDGSDPDSADIRYSGPLVLDSTVILKYIAYVPGRLPSEVASASYLVTEREFLLPVVSLVSDPEGLFSDSLGIYVRGKNGVTGYCNNLAKRNYCRDWERKADFEIFRDSERVFSSPGGIKIHGNCSRNFPQRSFALYARSQYGKGEFQHRFFTERNFAEYEALVLRNSGNDFGRSMMRDALMSEIAEGILNVDYSAYQPVTVFLNGRYWGLYNLREKVNEHHPAALHGINADKINLFENEGHVLHGSGEGLKELKDLLKDTLMEPEVKYRELESLVDLNSFIDYMIAQIYCANTDWPVKNIKFWNSNESSPAFRWILFDTDLGFGLSQGSFDTDMFRHLQDYVARGERADITSLLFNQLSQDDDFRLKFTTRLRDLLEYGLNPERVAAVISEASLKIKHEMLFHQERWMLPEEIWDKEIDTLTQFAKLRPYYLNEQLNGYLQGNYLNRRR